MSELQRWLDGHGLGKLASLLAEQDIDLDILPELTEDDLEKLGLSMGQRKRLLRALESGIASTTAAAPVPAGPAAIPRGNEAERRQLTVMFCDLVGSTAMSAKLDPEELRDILLRYRDATDNVIKRYDGTVARFLGDGILVYFGYPRAHEDDAERAVRAALAVVEVVSGLENAHELTLEVRIGIATGLVVVGDIIGMLQSEEGAVVGETPNLAARLQGFAEPNGVVIAQSTRALVGASFQYRDLGEHAVKGIPEPVQVWNVEGSRDVETRFAAAHGGATSPLVDREHELARILACWQRTCESHGQVVLVSGEAGFGKSRLVHSFEQQIGDGCSRLHLQCSPHYENSAYFPIITALSRRAGLRVVDAGGSQLEKLQRFVGDWSRSPDIALPLIASLLSVPVGGGTQSPATTSPEIQKEDTFEALVSLFVGRSTEQPLLIVFEDVHWIDPTSWEFLRRLAERITSRRILIVVTFRPDFSQSLPGGDHVARIVVDRLAPESASAVMSSILEGKSLPGALRDQILAKTDGVPLFVEELTKMVLDSKALRDAGDHYELTSSLPELTIPMTLQDSLMARLDQLAPVKEVAQVGAVLGREFDYELLAHVVTMLDPRELTQALARLTEAGLLNESGEPPEASYAFRHALIQDAAYASMLHSKRRTLHARIAQVLETEFPERAALAPEVLARHCEQGGRVERSIRYWGIAGQRALERSAVSEALAHAEKGLTLLGRASGMADRLELELELETVRGWASIAVHGYTAPQTGRAFSRARELCGALGDSPNLFSVLHGQWLYHLLQADVGVANDIAAEMLEASAGDGQGHSRIIAHRVQGTSAFWLGRYQSACEHLERALDMYESGTDRPVGVTGMFDVHVVGLDFMSLALLPMGRVEDAHRQGERALEAARASRALVSLAVVLQHGCLFHQIAGQRERVRERAAELFELSEREGYPFWLAHARFFQRWAAVGERADVASVRRVADAREAVIATGSRLFYPYYSALLAELYGRIDEDDRALELLALALDTIETSQERWFEAEVHRLRGEHRARRAPDHLEPAIEDLREAMEVARRQGATLYELRAATTLAELLLGAGASDDAREALAPFSDWLGAQPPLPDVERARRAVEQLG